MSIKYTTEEIVKQFKLKHGNKFDYSKVKYVNAKTKVTITCKEHGDFEQSPESHRRGSGCPICKGRGQTTKSIIKEFNKVHGGKYDYSRVDYKGSITPVSIICRDTTLDGFNMMPRRPSESRNRHRRRPSGVIGSVLPSQAVNSRRPSTGGRRA